jgi:hypothetical protein
MGGSCMYRRRCRVRIGMRVSWSRRLGGLIIRRIGLVRRVHILTCKGNLSKKTRQIIVINTLTKQENTIKVCGEESIIDIQDRYLAFNGHAKGYMWKRQGILLDMNCTLEENGIPDQSALFERVGMDEDEWLPAIHLYFRFCFSLLIFTVMI